MDLNKILTELGSLAGGVATAATGAGPLIAAGQAIIRAFEDVKQLNGGTAPADAEANHQALVAKVNQHADQTLGGLG
jgi:hypothetical protein